MMNSGVRLTALLVLVTIGMPASADTQNPPPTRPFADFARYELRPLEVSPEVAAKNEKDKSVERIREVLVADLGPIVEQWNKDARPDAAAATLVIIPTLDEVRKVGGATRFMIGAMAGSSHVIMHLKFIEEPGDKVIDAPLFYQHAAALSGAWTMASQDNAMLTRVVELAREYMVANYTSAVGGRTGYDK